MTSVHTDQKDGFLSGCGIGQDWQQAAATVVRQLGEVSARHRLGFLYVSEHFADDLPEIEVFMRQATGVPHWCGTLGAGVIGTGVEFYGEPSLSALVTTLAEEDFRIFSGIRKDTGDEMRRHEEWLSQTGFPVLVTHADPSNVHLPGLLQDLVEETSGHAVGGLGALARGKTQIADGLTGGGLSGAMIAADRVPMLTGLTQGCSPIGPVRTVTVGAENVILELDDRPALEVFKDDIGDLLARDLRRVQGYIHVGLPVPGADKRDYLVRNLLAIDVGHQALAIGANIHPGDRVVFCRRDPDAAVEDMAQMLDDMKRRLGGRSIRGGLYFSCAGRGPQVFDLARRETELIRSVLGSFPMAGYFANGEIHHDRLYGYTGVLTLFL